MQCPKCGAVQPDSDSCIYCQVIISKYLQRQEEQRYDEWGAPSSPAVSSVANRGFPIGKLLVLSLLVVAVAAWGWWARPFAPKAGKYNSKTGVYRNERFGFELSVPSEWKTYTVREAISCPTINREYTDQYFLLVSPTQTTDTMLVVDISGISLESMKQEGWSGIKGLFSSRHPVTYSSVDEINGIKLYRIGYEIGSTYREDSFFEANGKLIEVYFYVRNSFDSASQIAEMREVVDNGLRKL